MLRRTWICKKLREKHSRCGKYSLLRTNVTKFKEWLPFHCQSSFHAWNLAYRSTTMYHIPCFSCELAANEPCQPSQEGRTWVYHKTEYALDSGSCPQTGCHQEDQVPGAPPMPVTISTYLFSGVETSRNRQSNETSNDLFHLAPCDSHCPLTTLLSAEKLFPLLFPQKWLVNYISP